MCNPAAVKVCVAHMVHLTCTIVVSLQMWEQLYVFFPCGLFSVHCHSSMVLQHTGDIVIAKQYAIQLMRMYRYLVY